MPLLEKAKRFPRKPGVYLFKDAGAAVLYVGKAVRLRDRVRSYFTGKDERPQIRFLLKRTADIDCIVTDTEREALLLENTLIKQYRPRYNIDLRDDKSYVSIRVGVEHGSPGIALTRRIKQDGAAYFGPYDSAVAAREAVDQITRYFRIRTCSDREFMNRVRPCLKFDIGRCTGPCVGRISPEEYAAQVDEALLFLSGKSVELMHILERRMAEASEEQRFEDAARLRDALQMLRGIMQQQAVVRHKGGDHDAIAIARTGKHSAICILSVRGGALIGQHCFTFGQTCEDERRVIEEFLVGHYASTSKIPPRIYVQHKPEGLRAVAEILSERRCGKVGISVPLKGEMARLVELARTNAIETLAIKESQRDEADILARLGSVLKVPGSLETIECLDISNLSGREAVGSLVAFAGGKPDKDRYRIYNIRTIDTPDDYAMMREVILRRFKGDVGMRGAERYRPAPDLLLVDGGKGQLAIVHRALKECGVSLSIASIAKGEKKGRADQIFIPGRKNPLNLKRGSRELLLLMRIRDEAHRFGIAAHRKRRGKTSISSPLDSVKGLGPVLKKRLLEAFRDLDVIRSASEQELSSVPGISRFLAKRIQSALKRKFSG
jgi:excinuclease ABC subunit C